MSLAETCMGGKLDNELLHNCSCPALQPAGAGPAAAARSPAGTGPKVPALFSLFLQHPSSRLAVLDYSPAPNARNASRPAAHPPRCTRGSACPALPAPSAAPAWRSRPLPPGSGCSHRCRKSRAGCEQEGAATGTEGALNGCQLHVLERDVMCKARSSGMFFCGCKTVAEPS